MGVEWHVVCDVIVGYLLARGLRLVVMKAFLEPIAMWAGQKAYRKADLALGDRLPNWPPTAEP